MKRKRYTQKADDNENREDELAELGTEPAGVLLVDSTDNTPGKNRRGRRKGSLERVRTLGTAPRRYSQGNKLFSTPVKINGTLKGNSAPKLGRDVDRSARRKSTRALIESTVLGTTSDNDEEEEGLAQHIYDFSEEDEQASQQI